MTAKMHDDEVDHDADLVARLVAAQFPELADRPVTPFPSTGTVNAIYRLGDDLCVRLPRRREWSEDLAKELEWLPRLAPHLPLRIPEPVGRGEPTDGYPFAWAVYRWTDGRPCGDAVIGDERSAASDLAGFVLALRRLDPHGGPPTGRRPLRQLDDVTRAAIEASTDAIDSKAALIAWERALAAPAWDRTPVWIHTDLLPPNLLVDAGRLTAVLDFGGVGVGDPAADVVPAWSVFGPAGRAVYRAGLDVDDGTWERARGYALHQAALIIPYYRVTNPGFVTMAVRTVGQVLADVNG